MSSFKDLLADTVSQIKRANGTTAEQKMTEIKKAKYKELHKFRRRANEGQDKLNWKLAETIDIGKTAAERYLLDKAKSDLDEGEKLIIAERL